MALIKLNNKAVSNATAFGSISSLGSMTFIKKLTASGSSTLSFVDGSGGVDFSTYKEYVFTFKDIHPATDGVFFQFNGSLDSGSNYNVVKTSTQFGAIHSEGGSGELGRTGYGLAQSSGFQGLTNGEDLGADNDQSFTGSLNIFNPNSNTFVKHFISTTQYSHLANYSANIYTAGYFNTTSAVDAVRFEMSSGTFDGDICLYGIA